jgi:CHAT domain-containing protein
VERAAVSYLPSVAAWSAAAGAADVKPARRLLAIGAPVISKAAEDRVGLLRPGEKTGTPGTTERETRAVAALAGPGMAQVAVGANATAARLAAGLPAGSLAHVAVPLFLSDASPLHSLLVLSASGERDTGLTEIGSALSWETPASAVLFPTANGATGGASGEALEGLSWSLLVAGTPSVAVSRWPLAAKAPARVNSLVSGFYRAQLAAPSPAGSPPLPAQALQRAAKRMLAAPATKHPGHWAGLMVIGR